MIKTGFGSFLLMLVCIISLVFLSGCGDKLRLAPTEAQKESAVIHKKTVEALAGQIGKLVAGEKLPPISGRLADNAERQADAIVTYYGPPETIPDTSNIDILTNETVTAQAEFDAAQRPKTQEVVEQVEQGLGVVGSLAMALVGAGVLKGSSGIVTAVKKAGQAATAVKEVVQANDGFIAELEQSGYSALVDRFKDYQKANQTAGTEALVRENKVQAVKLSTATPNTA